MKYVVTAVNNLTGEREAISVPCSLTLIKVLLKDYKEKSRYKRHQPWSKFKIEESFEE